MASYKSAPLNRYWSTSFMVLVACSFLAIHLPGRPVYGHSRRHRHHDRLDALDGNDDNYHMTRDSHVRYGANIEEQEDIGPINPDNLLCGQSVYSNSNGRRRYHNSDGRLVIGGDPTRPGEHPYLVQLFINKNSDPHCGGALIESDIVLTAAHCTLSLTKSDSFVRLGVHGTNGPRSELQDRRILEFKPHPNYNPNTGWSDYDIAVLKIQPTKYKLESQQDHGSINRICMPEQFSSFEGPFVTSGWGYTRIDTHGNFSERSPVPLQFTVTYLENKLNAQLCSETDGVSSIAPGDSGSPLVKWFGNPRQAELIGLVSVETHMIVTGRIISNCYVNVMKLRAWISETIRTLRL